MKLDFFNISIIPGLFFDWDEVDDTNINPDQMKILPNEDIVHECHAGNKAVVQIAKLLR